MTAKIPNLSGKTLFITGASRGIGKEIALRAARDGANIAIAAKSQTENAKLPGTIFSAAREIEAAGGQSLALACDIRFEEQVEAAIDAAVSHFGGIDILVNNASAIDLRRTKDLPMKRFDLMHAVNARGTVMCSRLALPHLMRASNPHILTLSPPLSVDPRWYGAHLAYTMSKLGMSMTTLGLSREFRTQGIAVNSLWPQTTIATAAVKNLLGGDQLMRRSRRAEIVADAAYEILRRDSRECTGNFFLDEDVLRAAGVTEFQHYAIDPEQGLQRDLFL